jgi:hypothetical protein
METGSRRLPSPRSDFRFNSSAPPIRSSSSGVHAAKPSSVHTPPCPGRIAQNLKGRTAPASPTRPFGYGPRQQKPGKAEPADDQVFLSPAPSGGYSVRSACTTGRKRSWSVACGTGKPLRLAGAIGASPGSSEVTDARVIKVDVEEDEGKAARGMAPC